MDFQPHISNGMPTAPVTIAAGIEGKTRMGLTRLKIREREACKVPHTASAWIANMQKVERSAARGSLIRLVRP
jgi:hypothetical protein